jgi:hypothetical protein
VRGDRLQVGARQLDREVEVAPVADVDDAARPLGARQEARGVLDRVHGGREADALRAARGERVEPRERERQVAPALVAHEGVHLVDDDRAHVAQQLARPGGRQHQVEGFRRRDEHVRRPAHHRGAVGRGRVAGAQRRADLRRGEAELASGLADALERGLEVLLHVAAQGLERRDVDDLDALGGMPAVRAVHERVEGGEEGRERLARPGGCGDERVAPGEDLGPPALLRLRRRHERALEPGSDRRMKRRGECHEPGPGDEDRSSIQGQRSARFAT